jgi:glycosyltransferase involved in cell wall biosynthesis
VVNIKKMKKRTKVYLRLPSVADCGVGYYRQWLPLMTARKNKEVDMVCHDFTWGKRANNPDGSPVEPKLDDIQKAAEWADLIYFARNDVPQYIAEAGGLREFLFETKKKYVPIVLDIDDNVHATRPYNPGYRSFHPNSPHLTWNMKSLGVFDAITVSTEELKEFYSKFTDKEKIYVLPNSLDFDERDRIYNQKFDSELFKKKEGEIRIGWTGSAAHWENLKHIENAIVEIMKKYPQTTFYYTGLFGDLWKNEELKDRFHHVNWADLDKWPILNREVNFDIAIAPLADNDFNRAKSNLRVLEYASARFPVVCSPVRPYNCFKGEEEVLFAREDYEWFDQIEKLVLDAELRNKLSTNLYTRCKKEFDINTNYKIWTGMINDVLKKTKKLEKTLK